MTFAIDMSLSKRQGFFLEFAGGFLNVIVLKIQVLPLFFCHFGNGFPII